MFYESILSATVYIISLKHTGRFQRLETMIATTQTPSDT